MFNDIDDSDDLLTFRGGDHASATPLASDKMATRAKKAKTNAAFQSPRANGAHDFEVGKIPVQPYVAFHSRTEPVSPMWRANEHCGRSNPPRNHQTE